LALGSVNRESDSAQPAAFFQFVRIVKTDARNISIFWRKRALACIAHKSLEIFERCRLWQQNSPATPDYSAALFFGEKEFEAVCFGSFILKLALKWAWSAYLRAF
jgi:hypothetical protein